MGRGEVGEGEVSISRLGWAGLQYKPSRLGVGGVGWGGVSMSRKSG